MSLCHFKGIVELLKDLLKLQIDSEISLGPGKDEECVRIYGSRKRILTEVQVTESR